MRKSILTFVILLVTIMFTVKNLWGNSSSIYNDPYEVKNSSNLPKASIADCTIGTWTGIISSDWNNPLNWCNGDIPTYTTNVVIYPGENQPIINTNAECQNISIATNASLTISDTYVLNVYGKWVNNGNFTANLSTVIFNGPAQSITGTNKYFNVTFGGSGKKTIPTDVTVNGILCIEGSSDVVISAEPIYGPAATLRYNTSFPKTVGQEWPTLFKAVGGIIIDNTGQITLTRSVTLDNNIPITINSGASLIVKNISTTFGGDFHNQGNFTSLTGEITFGPGTATQLIDGFSTMGDISITKTGGNATFMGNVIGGGLKTTGTGILNLGVELTHTFTGNWVRGNGTINCGSSTLRFGGGISGSTGVLNAQDGTVEWFSSTPESIYAGTYNNLIISGSGIKTSPYKIYIKRILTIEEGAQFDQTSQIEKLLNINEEGYLNIHGILKVGESFPTNFSIFNIEGGTVEYYSTNLQYIDVIPYTNLILSGNTKNFKGPIQVNGNLTINNGAKCNLLSYFSSANTLTLGEYGQVSGNWGGINSGATFKNHFFFPNSTTGILSVINNSSISGIWIGKTSSAWELPSNWSDDRVPTSLSDAIITATGSDPVINSAGSCKDLNIQPGSILTIGGNYTLSISKDWTNGGAFSSNSGTVIFNGNSQRIGKSTFKNLTIAGEGVKTIEGVDVTGILSMEGTAELSYPITYHSTTTLQYNSDMARNIGLEWPTALNSVVGIILKNRGVISLNAPVSLYNIPLSIMEGATLDLKNFKLNNSKLINLECGGLISGSAIKGSSVLAMGGDVTISNCGKGNAPANIECPLTVNSFNFNVSKGSNNAIDACDLLINTIISGTINKTGSGTMSITGDGTLNYLTINQGKFIIQPQASLKIEGTITNNIGAEALIILSNAIGTGSLIIKGSLQVPTSATVIRNMTPGAWHLVSAPVTGQLIKDFLGANGTIPTLISDATTKAMREYISIGNVWGEFYTTGNTDPLDVGKGYCMRVKNSTAHEVIFTGTLQTGTKTINGLSGGNFNCIGNPYTSAIGINNQALGTNTENFFTYNTTNLEPGYGIYIWDKKDEANGQPGQYTVISNVPNPDYPYYYLQQGQGFLIKMATGKTEVSFTKAMQENLPAITLKSTERIWPAIQLISTADSINSSTLIAFHEGMTNGLDVTYDAGLLKSGSPIDVYTRLVDDYGISFAIQALPSDAYDQLIIPVGVDYSKGGAVSFSAKGVYLPTSCRPILEDRLTGIITDLSNKNYMTNLPANSAGTGRFYLHTSYATTDIDNRNNKNIISAKFINHSQIRIQGKVIKNVTVTFTDALGRQIISRQMTENDDNILNIPTIKPGIYLLSFKDSELTQTFKLAYSQ